MNLRVPSILLSVVALVVLTLLVLFFTFPQHAVFYRDEVKLVLPYLQKEGAPDQSLHVEENVAPVPYADEVTADLQVTAPDYTNVQLGSDRGLDYLQGLYVPFKNVSEEGVLNAMKEAQRRDVPGLVLQMKDTGGMLAWLSDVDYAAAYSTNNNWNLTATVNELKNEGFYLVAEIPCALDTALATRNPSVALKDMSGAVYTDELGSWVDPWNSEVRDYITALCKDLYKKGFDEVILTYVELPAGEVAYTRTISPVLDRTTCVTNFSIAVRRGLEEIMQELGTHLDVRMSHDAFTTLSVTNGQTFENMLRVFDRIVIDTETYPEDVKRFLEAEVDSTLRFVPGMTWNFAGGSWILTA